MPVTSAVEVRVGGIHGHGWFAANDIKTGECICKAPTRDSMNLEYHMYVSTKECATWPEEKQKKWDLLAYQIDEDTWLGYKTDKEVYIPEIQEYLVNHSCDGNCWYDENDDLIAMRDISKGEELTYDYALTESESLWMLGDHGRCMCGTSKCRGLIRGNDYLLPELQVRYKGHFHAYINKRIEVLTLKHTQEQTEEAKERLETQQESQQTTKQQQQQPQQQQPQQEQQQTTKSESAASSSSSSAASSTTALSSSSSSDSSTSSTTCT